MNYTVKQYLLTIGAKPSQTWRSDAEVAKQASITSKEGLSMVKLLA